MSTEEIVTRVTNSVARLNFDVEHQEQLPLLFDGFKTELLLKADDTSNMKVIDIYARVAVDTAKHRINKFGQGLGNSVTLSDFIPAFDYISSIASAGARARFRQADRVVFSEEVSELVRQSCPWC